MTLKFVKTWKLLENEKINIFACDTRWTFDYSKAIIMYARMKTAYLKIGLKTTKNKL